MGKQDENNLITDVRLMKITGLYQLLRSRGPNAFRWMAVAETVCLVASILALTASMIHCSDDVDKCAEYLLLMVACAMTVFKLHTVLRYSDVLWACVQTTRTDRLSYGRHRTRYLESGRAESISMSSKITAFRLTIFVLWILSPFVHWGRFTVVKYDGGRTRLYRTNVVNYIFAIDGVSHDEYFAMFYPIETISMIFYCHVELTFDVLLISLCIAGSHQLKTVADSFANLGAVRQRPTSSKS